MRSDTPNHEGHEGASLCHELARRRRGELCFRVRSSFGVSFKRFMVQSRTSLLTMKNMKKYRASRFVPKTVGIFLQDLHVLHGKCCCILTKSVELARVSFETFMLFMVETSF